MNEGWKRTIDDGFADAAHHQWDQVVRAEVGDYDRRLAGTPGYVPVDWTLILAMIWVESGGPKKREWFQRVMQFGNPGDGGYPALRSREGATSLIVPAAVLARVDAAEQDRRVLDDPTLNIQGGIGYLFTRMVRSEEGTIPDAADTELHHHVVSARQHDTGSSIAAREGTTLDELRRDNPGVNLDRLHDGQDLVFHKAHVGRKITGWSVFDEATVARRYNGGGDPNYAEKLLYVHGLLRADGGGAAGPSPAR
jgi:hypothetical protein